ncbi:MAG: hypothetical protein ABIA37_00315 [Candidatus Woesearchaeota archaeon]
MKELLDQSEQVLKKIEKISKFGSKYSVYPYQEVGLIVKDLQSMMDSLPEIETPQTQEELIQSELRRRLTGESNFLIQALSPKHYDFNTVISTYGIPIADIQALRPWLEENKKITIEAIERLYQVKNVESYELSLPLDIPSVRRQAEEFAAVHIQKYHKRLGKLLQDLTQAGGFLREINAVPTTNDRSYFHPLTNTLAIGIPAICFATEDGSLQIRERDLIALYGHEGMGHALNQVITKTNGLPYFLTKDTSLTAATMESVAQFYQNVIFEDLKNSSETQKKLGLEHKFDEVYQEAKDIAQLQKYKFKFSQYAITVLADQEIGQPQDPTTLRKKIELLNEVTFDPTYPLHFVEQHRYSFDSRGNLNPGLVSELRYCAQPIQRALEEFAKQGITYEEERSKIDMALLKGFWTPIGFVDNARLKAKQK